MLPVFSIVMPCYNAAAHLATSVGSVLAQTRQDWELIIVDDGSKDLSWPTLERLAADEPRIRIFWQPNAGAAAARNRGLRETRGACIAFLDSDDTWHPEFLDAMMTALDANPDAGIAYCGWQNIGLGAGCDEPFVPPEYENASKIESLLGGCRWPIHGALVRSQLIAEAGSFDETLSSCMDYDLWLRLGTRYPLVRVPRVLAYYHHHGGEQITRNRARIALNHWRAQQKYLRANPAIIRSLGKSRIRQLTAGELLHRGYVSYWKRDLQAAWTIFRQVMRAGYVGRRDWKYLLPALLPLHAYKALIGKMDKNRHAPPID